MDESIKLTWGYLFYEDGVYYGILDSLIVEKDH